MARQASRLVHGLALLLIASAVPVVLWLPRHHPGERLGCRPRLTGAWVSNALDAPDGSVTYRFLRFDEAGAIDDRLTLGRFVGGDVCAQATWDFVDAVQWFAWAPGRFDRQEGWVAENEPGWQISRWLRADVSSECECDCDRLFWVIQTLRFLDPESFANELDMLEASGRTVTICETDGPSNYDYETDMLFWNPTAVQHVTSEACPDRQWFRTDPLITLAHELTHAWHDLCRQGDTVGVEDREQIAIVAENRIRHALFLKDPQHWHLYPRPGHRETWPDLPGQSAQQAWRSYQGRVRY